MTDIMTQIKMTKEHAIDTLRNFDLISGELKYVAVEEDCIRWGDDDGEAFCNELGELV